MTRGLESTAIKEVRAWLRQLLIPRRQRLICKLKLYILCYRTTDNRLRNRTACKLPLNQHQTPSKALHKSQAPSRPTARPADILFTDTLLAHCDSSTKSKQIVRHHSISQMRTSLSSANAVSAVAVLDHATLASNQIRSCTSSEHCSKSAIQR